MLAAAFGGGGLVSLAESSIMDGLPVSSNTHYQCIPCLSCYPADCARERGGLCVQLRGKLVNFV